jgi:hypothetical protein
MGILDEAIREHLELKRQHGADDSEVENLEAEAFGPADRPDAVEAPPAPSSEYSEEETRVISPGSAVTAPAGEGDQLDKVFEATREQEATSDPEASATEHALPPSTEPHSEAAPDQIETKADPVAEAPGITPDAIEDDAGGDAGDALERERHALAGYPTEHYDVDAAIAEEDEIDVLSESSLSDELDRALDSPLDSPIDESSSEPETAAAPEPEPEPELATGEVVEDEEHDLVEGEFFDQDDPLEGTPDFLEETPEHDRLWFEQKEPKDFDFGD